MQERSALRLGLAPRNGGFSLPDYWVWCGSAIQGNDGRYHLFASRWPKTYPFLGGYTVASEIVRAVASQPEGPYAFEEVVLPARGAGYWDGRMTHNPTIHRWGDTFLLYYIGSTFAEETPPEAFRYGPPPESRQSWCNIRIGLATAPSVMGPWTRQAAPILEPRPERWDAILTTNPAPCVADDGSVLLVYRSNNHRARKCLLGVARAKRFDAPYLRLSEEPILSFPGTEEHLEDPYIWWAGDHYHMIAKDQKGGLTGEFQAGAYFTSRDGIEWQPGEPPKAYSRRIHWDDGTETMMGSLERPQLLIEDGRPTHLFAATGNGPGGFNHATHTWNQVIPIHGT